MIRECRSYYKDNPVELKKIDEFENGYCSKNAIGWYTRDSFIYRLVNKALRTLDIDIISKFRFFIVDLYQQLKQCHTDYINSLPTIDPNKIIRTVYRSQRLSQNEIDKLIDSVGDIICPTSFFSTTEYFMIAQSFVAGASGSECVIFQIDIPDSYYENINGGLKYNRPFFRLESLSQFQSESEIIFSMGTLFYIESVEQYDVWYVCLKLEGETEEFNKVLWMSEATENVKYNWQNRNSVDDRILLLTEKLPQSCRTIVNIYIKYGFFADEDSVIVAESLTTYQKGFEILSKCLPDHHYLFVIAKYLSIGILHNNKHDYSLAVHFGETALHLAQTYLHDDSDYLLISYNYLAVVHQFGDHYAEALSVYEKMLSIASEQNNESALLAIYKGIELVTSDVGDHDYQLVCLKKIVELERKLHCEDIEKMYLQFGVVYEMRENFSVALDYYKRHCRLLIKRGASTVDIIQSYLRVGNMYAIQKHYIAALHIYLRILEATILSLPNYDHSLLGKYETLIIYTKHLIKCNYVKKLRHYFRLLMLKSSTSTIFIQFIRKIKFLFYFELSYPTSLKTHLSVLLKQIYTEYNNLRMFETSLRNLQRSIKTFLKIKPACFAKIYHNAQILQNLRSFVDVYQRSLYLIQQAYFSKCHTERCKMRRADLSIERISNDIGAVVHNFVYSSHATLCQDRVRQKPRPPHRSVWIYRYRFCGCFKDSIASHNRTTGRWPKFSTI
ncbi:unnamed protein product [Rotaria magnacalcarata]|uniref:Uncharacterized protein n=1 Tax=Rotaria magnacalcarata TaxID=392030 RepID=A0A816QVR5_9BILA|nr:unnamed protein product [Rotaria magnacalcarata]